VRKKVIRKDRLLEKRKRVEAQSKFELGKGGETSGLTGVRIRGKGRDLRIKGC